MARCHLFRPLTDATGLLLAGASVSVLDPDTNTLIGDVLWADDTSSITLTNPFQVNDGFINFYLTNPRRVLLLATLNQNTLGVFLDVYPPADEVVTGVDQIQIINTPVPGSVLVASSVPGEAMWINTSGLQPAVPPEAHHFLAIQDPGWAVNFTQTGPDYHITLTIPTDAPWDGSGAPGSAVLNIFTYSAQLLDGTQPRFVDFRSVDMATQTNTYSYTANITDPLQTLYWICATDSTSAVQFDWRRG